jgi:hypothetical protein
MMRTERGPSPLVVLSDDELGTVAVALVVSELQWTPDVAPAVMDRISRDAVAYPEHFDRRPEDRDRATIARPNEPSARRTITRIAVIGVIVAIVVALVVLAATANASVDVAFLGVLLSPVLEAP